MWRLIYFIPVWILVFLISFPFHLLGLIIIPLACIFKAYKKVDDNLEKPADGAIYIFTWWFMWPWNNTHDGIACRNYYESSFERYGYLDMIITVFVWSALRNPINNLEKLLSPKYDFEKLRCIGSVSFGYKRLIPCWYLIWQGPFGGFYKSFMIKGVHRYVLVGYKLRNYQTESSIPISQKDGVGMTFRLFKKV